MGHLINAAFAATMIIVTAAVVVTMAYNTTYTNDHGISFQFPSRVLATNLKDDCTAVAGAVILEHQFNERHSVKDIFAASCKEDGCDYWGRYQRHAAEAVTNVANTEIIRSQSRAADIWELKIEMMTAGATAAMISVDIEGVYHTVALLITEDGDLRVVDYPMAMQMALGTSDESRDWDGSIRTSSDSYGAWYFLPAATTAAVR